MDDENKRNNLFDFATSELSQDAFICWLIEWINHEKEDQNLYKTAKLLLDKFFELCNIPIPVEYRNIIVKKQFENIDVLVVVNKKYVIIIEDKTNTENHSGQLNRYNEIVRKSKREELPKDFSDDNLLSIYFKTGNQSNLSDVKENKYIPFMRGDFLKILNENSKKINNAIFKDYHDYLQNIEKDTKSYLTKKVNDWNWWAWQGFLMDLYDNVIVKRNSYDKTWENWHYVNNASGGFWGLSWDWFDLFGEQKIGIFLLLELEEGEETKKRLCFKVHVENKEIRKEIRDKLFEITKQNNNNNEEGNRPHFRTGEYMTFWIHKQNIFEDCDIKDYIENTKNIMEQAQKQLKIIANKYNSENK